MPTQIYAYVVPDDGSPRYEAKFVGDQTGVRGYRRDPDDRNAVVEWGRWLGANLRDRLTTSPGGGPLHVMEWTGVDDPLGFTLEGWSGCHCGHILKRYRPPNQW